MTHRGSLLAGLLEDLDAESGVLDAVVGSLDGRDWLRPTLAEGWTVAAQIGHLAWTHEQALLAATDPGAFARALAGASPGLGTLVDDAAVEGGDRGARSPAEALAGGPPRAARTAPGAARRDAAALVRPADECHIDGQRPADGDLGPRLGRH